MLPRDVIEDYLKSYREYLILKAEKALELKFSKRPAKLAEWRFPDDEE